MDGTFWIQLIQLFVEDSSMNMEWVRNEEYQYLTIAPAMKIVKNTNVQLVIHYRVQIPVGGPGSFSFGIEILH